MIELPEKPFTTVDFSPKGGGIDFLGLRWVSLTIVGRYLIPELNNVTQDLGMFCIGAWIPWKFRQLCRTSADYTEAKYRAFREKIEVAVSMTFSDEAGLNQRYGSVRRQLGSTQKCGEPQMLTFRAAERGPQNTLFAAANYGPALQALGLVETYRSRATEEGKFLRIPISSRSSATIGIVHAVEESLQKAKNFRLLESVDPVEITWGDVNKLGKAGLDPTVYRGPSFKRLKRYFRDQLLPRAVDSPGYRRTITARLLVATLKTAGSLSREDVRDSWYIGWLNKKTRLKIDDSLKEQCLRWSCLMARQYQRYPLEVFLWCFEEALANGARSIDDVVSYWQRRCAEFNRASRLTVQQFFKETAGALYSKDALETSRSWNRQVEPNDDRFEHIEEAQSDEAPYEALRMIAGWYWRARQRLEDPAQTELMQLGGADRIGMAWFIKWLEARKHRSVTDIVRDIFSHLVFAQHVRVALARFDGTSQRLRFGLADNGIEPTTSARKDLAKKDIPWMPDRLDSLIGLLCDCDVLREVHGKLSLGPEAQDL
jgi:hypothetical protein